MGLMAGFLILSFAMFPFKGWIPSLVVGFCVMAMFGLALFPRPKDECKCFVIDFWKITMLHDVAFLIRPLVSEANERYAIVHPPAFLIKHPWVLVAKNKPKDNAVYGIIWEEIDCEGLEEHCVPADERSS
jgi:hypothetical protein